MRRLVGVLAMAGALAACVSERAMRPADRTPVSSAAHAAVAPPREYYLRADDATVFVRELSPPAPTSGAAPAVLLVHGCCHSGRYWLHTPDGREGFAPLFARAGFRVIVPDLPDHGLSPPRADWLRTGLEPSVRAIRALIARERQVIVVGHSMGAQVVVRALTERALHARVAGVVLLAPVPPPELVRADRPPLPADQPVQFDAALARQLFASGPHFPAEAFEQYLLSLWPESPAKIDEFQQPGRAAPVGEGLLADRPALIVGAEGDFLSAAAWRRQADYLGTELALLGADWGLPDHGHMYMIERGNERIAARLLQWLRAHAPAPATAHGSPPARRAPLPQRAATARR